MLFVVVWLFVLNCLTREVKSKTQDVHLKKSLSFVFDFLCFFSSFLILLNSENIFFSVGAVVVSVCVVLKKRLAVQFVALVYFPTAIPGYLLAMTGYV